MKHLEDKIRDIIFDSEPPAGHKQRFEKRLNIQFGVKRSIKWQLPAYAASIIILVSAITILLFNNQNVHSNSQLILSLENEEIVESEVYFQNLVARKIALIEKMDSTSKINIKDIHEFDESLKNLKNDLMEAPGDERIVAAVFNTYMLKIEALDNIVKILQKTS